MLIMIGLYSKVVYSLWIKGEERVSGTQQVTKIQRIELIPYQVFLQISLLKASLWVKIFEQNFFLFFCFCVDELDSVDQGNKIFKSSAI